MIQFQNVTKIYQSKTVLSHISFEIKKGEFTVLIGPSGCGKTTLLKMINKLITTTEGKILINGQDIKEIDAIQLRRKIGYVIQQTGLFSHMTIRENIELIPKLQKIDKNLITEKSIELMKMVGLNLDEYLDRFPAQLSGGQQQRVGVARAFACDPDIILMDEPFSALDPITKSQLQDELIDLQSKLKKTIVFVTHDMDEAAKLGDKICLLNQGKIVQYDTPEELMKNPINEFASEFIGKYRIWSSPELIRAEDIMITNPVCAPPEWSLQRCLERMRRHKIDSLMITRKDFYFLGIISAKTIQSVADKSQPVSSLMRPAIFNSSPNDSIIDILNLVNQHKISTIPVLDENGYLKGLVTKSSLVTTLSQQFIDTPEVL